MLQKFFRSAERALIAESHDDWKKLKGAKKEIIDGEVICPKSRLVSRVVSDLLKRFPERDYTKNPHSPLKWDQEARDSLWERTRQVFYNLDKASVSRSGEEGRTDVKTSHAPSFNTLFKRHFASDIVVLKDKYLKEKRYKDGLTAYNAAVRHILDETKKSDPKTIERLEVLAVQVKSDLRATVEEQPEDLRRAMLEVLPADIIKAVRGWEKRTNARIYVMALWPDMNSGHTKFDYASRACGNYIKSAIGKRIFEEWVQNMMKSEDTEMRESAPPKPTIYPDAQGWPTFPRTDLLKVSQDEERMLFRRYFHLTSLAAGGVTPSWTRIEQDGNANRSVLQSRLPNAMPTLGNIKNWKRADMNAMRKHLIDSQTGVLPQEQHFSWYRVPTKDGAEPIYLETPLKAPISGVSLPWTSGEVSYGAYIFGKSPSPLPSTERDTELPPARTTHVYSPFNIAIFEELEDLHAKDPAFFQLILNTAKLERLGPIHCPSSLTDLCGVPNLHLPQANVPNLVQSDDINKWFENDFFSTQDNADTPWTIMTFKTWLLRPNAFTHIPTKTVYGGPLGI
ncbi:unnamed protein product [Rhizoctonia solani]|uniref:Uncharacterized protein n=1 Tax=Rhizoctonia solani TaxID=456999 RepID=A0A8H3BYE0_9AGAM|nr:unnamed protein product [Rhizoctonia solani]CAE6474492.1 unnamed protein product [Rhizoctonia solani]